MELRDRLFPFEKRTVALGEKFSPQDITAFAIGDHLRGHERHQKNQSG